jgi:cytochrome P450
MQILALAAIIGAADMAAIVQSMPAFVPPHVVPPARAIKGFALVLGFLRNPLAIVPQDAYEQDYVAFNGLGPRFAWVTGPELIKSVLLDESDKFSKSVQIEFFGPLLGQGILTSEGADWKWQRQVAAPMFRRQDLLSFVPVFVNATHHLLDRWRRSPAGTPQQIEADMTQVTFDIICASLLPSSDATVGLALEASADRLQRSAMWRQLYVAAHMPTWLPQPGARRIRAAVRSLRAAVGAMLMERRRVSSQRDDLIRRLMAAHDPVTGATMNDEQLIDNLLTFYLAGHETTSKALTWTLYLLACSPQWTQALTEEIANVTGGKPVCCEHIDRLVLTQQVIKESMRLYPPVPTTSRQAIGQVRLGEHLIKAGTSIVIPIYAMHRHQKRWRHPNAFDPTRFAPGNEGEISRYQYMPFGAGPRICIGMAFAMIEITSILATILQKARLAPVNDHAPVPVARITLQPKGGMPLRTWVD